MASKIKIAFWAVFCIAIIAPGLSLGDAQTKSSTQQIKIHTNGLLSVHASNAPLKSLLHELSQKADFVVLAADDLDTPVSCIYDDIELDGLLRRLLAGRSFSIFYRIVANNGPLPEVIQVFGTGSMTTLGSPEAGRHNNPAPPPVPSMNRRNFSEALKMPHSKTPPMADQFVFDQDWGRQALKLGPVAKHAAIKSLGLCTGDIIYDINGRAVLTTADLFQALQAAVDDISVETTLIRIDRRSASGESEPIYLELR